MRAPMFTAMLRVRMTTGTASVPADRHGPPVAPRPGADAVASPRRRPLLRIVVVLLATTGTLLLLGAILSDVQVKDFAAALLSAALIGLANALVWPLVIRFALPLTVLTLGLGAIALNGALVLLVSAI